MSINSLDSNNIFSSRPLFPFKDKSNPPSPGHSSPNKPSPKGSPTKVSPSKTPQIPSPSLAAKRILHFPDEKIIKSCENAILELNLLPQYPTSVQKQPIEPCTPNQLEPESSIPQEIMQDVEQLVDLELLYAREKKVNEKVKCTQILVQTRKKILGAVKESGVHNRTALWYACEKKVVTLADDPAGPYLLFHLQRLQRECLQTIGNILHKQKNAKAHLNCVTNDAKLFISTNNPVIFSCAADANCPKKTYTRITCEKLEKTWQQNIESCKSVKQILKEKIVSTVQEQVQVKIAKYGSLSLPIKIALDNFNHLLTNSRLEDPSFNTQSEVLDEMCALLDGYCKNGGALAADMKLQEIYAQLSFKKQPDGAVNLYKYTEEFFRKDNKNDATFVHRLDVEVVGRLQACLQNICVHLEQQLPHALKIETEAKLTFCHNENEEMTQLISSYLIGIIKIHKNLSYNRFTLLFALHTTFLTRLQVLLNKVPLEQRDQVQAMVEKVLSPEISLLETKKHRKTQARHTWKEPAAIRKHGDLSKINQYIRTLTLGEPHDLASFQAAHVIPFPALFASREYEEADDSLKKASLDKRFTSAFVSIKYMEAGTAERNKLFAADIETLFAEHHENPVGYVKYALELLMKISLEEASLTVHLPGLFNQEADGASEKYISMPKDVEINELFQKNRQQNGFLQQKGNMPLYTEKVYKYILGHDLFEMVKKQKALNLHEVMLKEANYIEGVKFSLARRIKWVTSQPPLLTHLLLAVSLCNVFFGLKNAEALGSVDLTVGDKQFIESLNGLHDWVKKMET